MVPQPFFLLAAALMLPSLALASACPQADREAIHWLDKMSRSANEVSYHGVVTYQRGGEDMQVVQVAHSVGQGTTSEQLTQLTGQGAQVVREGHPLDCIHPGHKLLLLGEEFQQGRCGIAEHYRFRVTDGERIAGRKAVRILIEPRDMYRHGYIMELDRATGLLLKTMTLGRGERVLEKFQFADLSFEEKPSGSPDIDVIHHAGHPAPGAANAGRSVSRPWDVGWLPGGFTPTDSQAPEAGRRTFTDGLAVFSVFLEELEREIKAGEGVARTGSTISYTRGRRLVESPVLVTVVGEVPVNTARMVADSVRWGR